MQKWLSLGQPDKRGNLYDEYMLSIKEVADEMDAIVHGATEDVLRATPLDSGEWLRVDSER